MLINNEIEDQILKKYREMKPGQESFEFTEGILKGLSIYVDKMPKFYFFKFTDGDKNIFVGSQEK